MFKKPGRRFRVSHDNNTQTIELTQLDDYLGDIMGFREDRCALLRNTCISVFAKTPGYSSNSSKMCRTLNEVKAKRCDSLFKYRSEIIVLKADYSE